MIRVEDPIRMISGRPHPGEDVGGLLLGVCGPLEDEDESKGIGDHGLPRSVIRDGIFAPIPIDASQGRRRRIDNGLNSKPKGLGIGIHGIQNVLVSHHRQISKRKTQGKILLINELVP